MEVIGVVFAASQIVASALNCYVKSRADRQKYKPQILYVGQLIQALGEQRLALEADIKSLLAGAQIQELDLDTHKLDDCLSLLKLKEVELPISQHLGDAYLPYKAAIEQCARAIGQVSQRLGHLVLERDQIKVKLNRRGGGELDHEVVELVKAYGKLKGAWDWKRKIKFEVNIRDITHQIQSLKNATNSLGCLRRSSETLRSLSSTAVGPQIKNVDKLLQRARKHAKSLYNSLLKAYTGNCHEKHEMRLFLSTRAAPLKKRHEPVTFDCTLNQPHARLTITIIEEKQSRPNCIPTPSQSTGVTIQAPTDDSAIVLQNNVQNLCSFLEDQFRHARPFRLHLNQHDNLLASHPVQASTPHSSAICLQTYPLGYVTLDEALRDIEPNQVFLLSAYLTSSLLQLLSTSWMPIFWKKEQICLPHDCHGLDVRRRYGQEQPFICYDFTTATTSNIDEGHNVRRALLELGIVFLEMTHRKRFEDYAHEHGLCVEDNTFKRQEAADRWIKDDVTWDRMLPFYRDIVVDCIECAFGPGSVASRDLNNEAFRLSLCERVLKPLCDNCYVDWLK